MRILALTVLALGLACALVVGTASATAQESDDTLDELSSARQSLVLDVEVRGNFVALHGHLLIGVRGERAERGSTGAPGSGPLSSKAAPSVPNSPVQARLEV